GPALPASVAATHRLPVSIYKHLLAPAYAARPAGVNRARSPKNLSPIRHFLLRRDVFLSIIQDGLCAGRAPRYQIKVHIQDRKGTVCHLCAKKLKAVAPLRSSRTRTPAKPP